MRREEKEVREGRGERRAQGKRILSFCGRCRCRTLAFSVNSAAPSSLLSNTFQTDAVSTTDTLICTRR
jgi:hypothetical protein